MNLFDRIVLLLTGLTALYLLYHFFSRYSKHKALHDIYYMLGFGVLLVSGLLLIVFGWGILDSPYVLTVATLIPLGIAMGLMNQYRPSSKKYFSWFALVGLLAIAVTSVAGLGLRRLAVPIFHGGAGLIIFLLPFFVKDSAPGFWMVGIGGALIGLGGIALAFLVSGSQLLFFSQKVVLMILAPLLFLMTLAFTFGFQKDLGASQP
jgi:hypothetical protein